MMNKLLKIILPLLLFTLLSNSTFATVSHEGQELKEMAHSARKLGIKTKEGIKRLAGFKQQKQALEGLEGAVKHELYKK